MKQRIRVAAIIRDEKHSTLLLQRSKGRLTSSPVSLLELPSSKINFGEQPEEAIVRIIHDHVGVFVQRVSLLDVITFTRLPGSSEVINLYIIFSISLASTKLQLNLDRYTSFSWVHADDLKYIDIDDASRSILDILHDKPSTQITTTLTPDDTIFDAIVFTDGGSRGNPGPSAVGYYITTPAGDAIDRGGEFIGVTSSRQAEYLALRRGVEKALELGLKSIQFRIDNLMIVNHLTGVYQVKNRDIWPLYDDLKNLLSRLDHYSISHIKRDQNLHADAEVNKALDAHAQRY